MDQVLKLFSNSDQLLIAVSLALVLLGIITPKKFLGFEVDWTVAKSACVFLIGLGLLGFSVWHSTNVTTTAADADDIREGTVHAPSRSGRPGS